MIAATTDFITITDFVPAFSFEDTHGADSIYFPVDNNGVIYQHHDKNQLCFVRIINCTFIPSFAFASCNHLRIVLMDDSVLEIGDYAFSDCTLLQNIKLSRKIQYIRFHAFDACTSLSSMFIPNSCRNIDINAFFNCLSLIILVIPYHTDVYNSIVKGCSKLLRYSPYEEISHRPLVNKWIKACFQYLPFHQFCCSTNIRSLAMYTYLHTIGQNSGLETDHNQMNALHILLSNPYISGHDDAVLGNYLKLCPKAGIATDKFGCTPFHYLVKKKKNGFTMNMVEMYVKYCPDIQNDVVFQEEIPYVYTHENGIILKLEQEMIVFLFHYFCPKVCLLGPIHLTESYIMQYSF